MILMEPELEGRIEQSLDSNIGLRNLRRSNILSIVKAGGKPNPDEVHSCGYFGSGQLGAIFDFGVRTDSGWGYQVAKIATYAGDPWLQGTLENVGRFISYEQFAPAFANEAAAMLAFRGNILVPEIYDFGVIETADNKRRPFIIMEEVLGRRILDEKNPPGQEERAKIIYQYLNFLNDIHAKGLVGVKDSGVQVQKELVLIDGNPSRIKVLDLGGVKLQSPQTTPVTDLQILGEGLFDDRARAHIAKLGDSVVVTPEFDEGLRNMRFTSASEASDVILKTYPQFGPELNEVHKLSKPEGLPFKQNLVRGLMEKRKI